MAHETNLSVCNDCILALANDEYSHLTHERMLEVEAGFRRLHTGGAYFLIGDESEDVEFSKSSCECCLTGLAGSRHSMIMVARTIA